MIWKKEAGGCPDVFLENIETMTVGEMIEILAQNRVRFTTVPRSPEVEVEDISGRWYL